MIGKHIKSWKILLPGLLVIDCLHEDAPPLTGLDDVKCNFPLYCRKVLLFLSWFFFSFSTSCCCCCGVYFFLLLFPAGGRGLGKNLGNISGVFRSNIESPPHHRPKDTTRATTGRRRELQTCSSLPSSVSFPCSSNSAVKTYISDDGFGLFCWKPYSRTVSNWSRRIFTSSRDGFCTGIVFYVFLFLNHYQLYNISESDDIVCSYIGCIFIPPSSLYFCWMSIFPSMHALL